MGLDDQTKQQILFNKVKWMDVRDFHHLPSSANELADRRVARGGLRVPRLRPDVSRAGRRVRNRLEWEAGRGRG